MKVPLEDDSITLTSRITASDWTTTTVTLVTPQMVEQTLTEYEEDGDARVYSYTINNVSEKDAGTYTFRVTDGFGFQLETETELSGKKMIDNLLASSLEFKVMYP